MTGPVLFCGDAHSRFDHINQAGTALRASAVVLLGDIEARKPLDQELLPLMDAGIPVYWILGNHDSDRPESLVHLLDSRLAAHNLGGRVVALPDGRKLLGLNGIFRASVWDPSLPTPPNFRSRQDHAKATPLQARWRGSVPLRHWTTVYPEEFDQVADLQADILVHHEAGGYHHQGWPLLDDLARNVGASLTVHGHHHDRLESSDRWAQQGFESYGVGLRGITSIDRGGNATVIVPGELDAQRNFRQQYIDVFEDLPPEGPT